jgi:hypothetical protein
MPIDTSIAMGVKPMQIESPVNQLANVLQIQGAQQANQLNAQKLQQTTIANDRQNRLQSLLGGFDANTTDEQRSNALKNAGYFDQADLLDKNANERAKTKSEGQFKMAEALSKFGGIQKDLSGQVFAQPTLENATRALQQAAQYHKMLGFGDMDISGELQSLQGMTSPDQIKQWAAGHSIAAEKLLPKTGDFNGGGYQGFTSTDPVTGAVTMTGKQAITESENNKATNARTAADNAASRAVQIRGQNMTDQRSRDLNAITQAGNQDKPLNDSQSKAALFGSRMKNADSILGELADSGVTTSNPGANAGWGVGSVVGALQSGKQQQLDQAKRDFVNAVLRRESGASISPTEFDSAEKQYFPSIGDSKETKAQKDNARAIAIRGMLEEVPSGQRDRVVSNIIGKSPAPAATAVPSDIQALLAKHGGK